MFSGRCQKCYFSFHMITEESGFSVFHYENKTQFIVSSSNLKGLAQVTIMRSNHTLTCKTQRCTRQVVGLAPSLFLATSKALLVGGRAALGYDRFYPKRSTAWDTQGRDRFLVQL